jgi:hypothetical protein
LKNTTWSFKFFMNNLLIFYIIINVVSYFTEAVKGLQTSDFRLQTLVPSRSLIANIAFAKLANI